MKKGHEGDRRLELPAGGRAAKTPYPTFDVAKADKWQRDWDEKTRRLVQARVENVPEYRFFSPPEARLLEALCARLIPQADRLAEERVPIGPWIDERLAQGNGLGYRYETMPDDRVAYRLGLRGFDETATVLSGGRFVELGPGEQDEAIRQIAAGSPPGEVWRQLPARLFFATLMNDVIATYYAHPASWSEIGFSGPASPRGHVRLQLGQRDPWEADEQRPHSSVDLVRGRKAGDGEPARGGPTH